MAPHFRLRLVGFGFGWFWLWFWLALAPHLPCLLTAASSLPRLLPLTSRPRCGLRFSRLATSLSSAIAPPSPHAHAHTSLSLPHSSFPLTHTSSSSSLHLQPPLPIIPSSCLQANPTDNPLLPTPRRDSPTTVLLMSMLATLLIRGWDPAETLPLILPPPLATTTSPLVPTFNADIATNININPIVDLTKAMTRCSESMITNLCHPHLNPNLKAVAPIVMVLVAINNALECNKTAAISSLMWTMRPCFWWIIKSASLRSSRTSTLAI